MKQLFILSTLLFSFFSQPSLNAQCSGTVLSLSASTHSQTGTTGSWTVPAGGPFKIIITAKGAKGGDAPFDAVPQLNGYGGKGALMSGTFIVSPGQVLQAIAGAPGGDGPNLAGGGGGGGTGVQTSTNIPLVIAGGGGGARVQKNNGGDGTVTNTGSGGGTWGGCGNCGTGGGGFSSTGGDYFGSSFPGTGGGAGYNGLGGTKGSGNGGNGGGGSQ